MTAAQSPDTAGLWDATAGVPEAVRATLESAQRALEDWPPIRPGSIRSVALIGLGTGATACAAAASLTASALDVPAWVGHGPVPPAFVGEHTLVVAVTCSGTAADTMTAAREAARRGASVVVVAGPAFGNGPGAGGDIRWSPLVAGGATARAALGPAVVSVLVALSRAGLVPDPAPSAAAAADALGRRRDAFVARGGPAETLARRIGRTIPLVYGSGIGAVAAQRWKAQINLNAKTPAFWGSLPDAALDELAGWGQGGDITRQVMTLVQLRHPGEDSETALMFDAVAAAMDEVMADVVEVWAEGGDDLARFLDLALLGDLVSLHLASGEGVDPGPTPAIDDATARPS